MINIDKTIISQYETSPTLLQLVHDFDQYIDPRTNFDEFYYFVWNVDTAQGFGLDIWGRIVNVSRELIVPSTAEEFRFSEEEPDDTPFLTAPFRPIGTATENFILADDAYRKLILAKALTNISAMTASSVNTLLQNMFVNRGRCYVNDLGGMAMRYVFEFLLEPYEIAIIEQSGVFPRPAGVFATFIDFDEAYFGFSEAGDEPFGQFPFLQEGATHAIS